MTEPAGDDLELLVARICDRDQSALGLLFDSVHSRVYGIALRILRQAEDAEEVTMDVFKQIWLKSHTYAADRGTVLAWCAKIAYSRAIDAQRRRRPTLSLDEAHLGTEESAYVHETSTPEQAVIHSIDADLLGRAMAQLPPQRRRLIALAFGGGLSHEDIAARTGIPLGTVKSHVRRGLQKLQELLRESGFCVAPDLSPPHDAAPPLRRRGADDDR